MRFDKHKKTSKVNTPTKYRKETDSQIYESNSINTQSFIERKSILKKPKTIKKKIISIDLREAPKDDRIAGKGHKNSPVVFVTNTSNFNSHFPVHNNYLKKAPASPPKKFEGLSRSPTFRPDQYANSGHKAKKPEMTQQGSKKRIQIQLQDLIEKSKNKFYPN